MKKVRDNKNSISALAVLLVFGIFAICVLAVLLEGASTYEKINSRDQSVYEQRTCAQYLATRVRQADGPLAVTSFGDGDAMVFDETMEGESYQTWIYCYDGWLREYFGLAEAEPLPELGEQVLKAEYLSLTLDGNLLWLLLEDEAGEETELQLYLRSGGEARYEE